MTNIKLLKDKIVDSGMTMVAISKKTGILRETMYNRFNGKGEFTASEIKALSDVLQLDVEKREEIFFSDVVE